MKKKFEIGDIVYLKSESEVAHKRVWEITAVDADGKFTLSRKVRGFVFLESAKSDELKHRHP